MLIEFVGCPSSGKTTIAAKLFARIKEAELPAEFLVEQARSYIVEAKLFRQTQDLVLDDRDQRSICEKQLKMESDWSFVCSPETILICDSSPLNSFLYMGSVTSSFKGPVLARHRDLKPLVFECGYVNFNPLVRDSNRIHSQTQIKAIDEKVREFLVVNSIQTIPLQGSLDSKVAKAFDAVMAKVLE